jgi:hypothetical protein
MLDAKTGADGPAIRANVDFWFDIAPADGIRLPFFLEAETSERRRFSGSSRTRTISLTVRQRTTHSGI